MELPKMSNIKMNLISSWQYDIINKDCSYCKFALNESSPEMYEKGVQSKVITNTCGHGFHCECIKKWLTKSKLCPICMQKWNKEI